MSPHVFPGADAGWFTDPEHPGRIRWWNGTAWTSHVQELPPPPTEGLAASPATYPTASYPTAASSPATYPTSTFPTPAPAPEFAPTAPVMAGAGAPMVAAPMVPPPSHAPAGLQEAPAALGEQQPMHMPPRVVPKGRLVEIARARPHTRLGANDEVGSYVPEWDHEDLPAELRDDNDTVDKDDHIGSPMTGEVWVLALLPVVGLAAILIFLQLDAFENNWYLGWLTLGAFLFASLVIAAMDGSSLKGRNIDKRVPGVLGVIPPLYLIARATVVSPSSALPLVAWLLATGTVAGYIVTVAPWVFMVPAGVL